MGFENIARYIFYIFSCIACCGCYSATAVALLTFTQINREARCYAGNYFIVVLQYKSTR